MSDDNESLTAAIKLLGDKRGRALLGCDWGTQVALPDDRQLCGDQARQRVVVHGAGGPRTFKLCDRHAATIEQQTDPHAGGNR